MIRGFTLFGQFVVALSGFGLAAGIFESLTGIRLLPGMAPISLGIETVGAIAVVLAGAFPMVFVLTRILKRPLTMLGKKMGINEPAAAGLIATLANSIASFSLIEKMNPRGKVLNVAFAVSAAFVFGDHLGFAAGFAPEILTPMIIGKLAGGISALILALMLTKKD